MSSSSEPEPRPRGMSLDAVYVVAALALTALKTLLTPIVPHDFWWHLAMGRLIVRDGRIPTADTFSFTQAGQPYFDQSWLAQVLLYGLHRLGGVPLIVAVQALVAVAAYGLLLWVAIRRTGRVRLAVAALLLGVLPISYDNWLVRPQSYAFPLFAATLAILTAYRERWWSRPWLLVPLMAVWANLHGSFVLGLALVAGVLAGEGTRRWQGDDRALTWPEWRRLAGWGGAAALAVLANPRGAGVLTYVRDLVASPTVTAMVTEWQSPSPRDLWGALFFLFVIALFLALVYAGRQPNLTDVVLLVPFLWLGLSAGRSVVWFAMVAFGPLVEALGGERRETGDRRPAGAPALSGSPGLDGREAGDGRPAGAPAAPVRGSGSGPKPVQGLPAANAVLAGALALAVVAALPWARTALGAGPPLLRPDTPVAAVERLRALPVSQRPRRLFHSLGTGSYLTWAAPEQRVFIDPRFELYPVAQLRDYRRLSAGSDAGELLRRYRIDGLLLSPESQEGLIRRLERDRRWRAAYRDSAGVLLLPR